MKQQKESIITTLASIAVPLVQIIAVTSIALTDQLHLTGFFQRSEVFPLVNAFAILLTLSAIGIISTWNNMFVTAVRPSVLKRIISMVSKKTNNIQNQSFAQKDEDRLSLMKKIFWLFQLPAFILIISTILLKLSFINNESRTTIQYVSYVAFLVSSGIIIFIWLQDYLKRQSYIKDEDFFPNLINALRTQGIIKEKNIQLLEWIPYADNNSNRLALINIETMGKYYIFANFPGAVIYRIWKSGTEPDFVKKAFTFEQQN